MPLRHKDIKRRSNVTTSKGLAAIASGLEPIAKQLVSIYGADQTLRANVVEKECLWIEASEIEAINTKRHGLIEYNEVDAFNSLTWIGKFLYGRLPSARRWHSPQTLPFVLVGMPLLILGLVFSTGAWRLLPMLWALILFGLLMALIGAGSRSLNRRAATQANLVRWPFVKGEVQWSVLHYRRKIDDGVLFQIKAFRTDCPLCGDTVDLELGRCRRLQS
ncbi:hypothetical protein SAMN06272759_12327 [Novosphingobium sp. B1]|nr:hypothetical protein SAMN06272759_12327 [Novosphingobium sp. B1]